eukprot:TRINITY_DN101924_c0_g1_i1.p1 TRINITY_DN101924_c0_g1~~TRINITY_DN101924_c0_g1_i1.p1  ORF type:complete len:323 (+),score=58.50 TRINITY_DN101924_c0_g1_i1:61-1029(+)
MMQHGGPRTARLPMRSVGRSWRRSLGWTAAVASTVFAATSWTSFVAAQPAKATLRALAQQRGVHERSLLARRAFYYADSGPFLTLEEDRIPKRRISKRERTRRRKARPPPLLPRPSEDSDELVQQIRDTKRLPRFLEFLPNALHSPAFAALHVVECLALMAQFRYELSPTEKRDVLPELGADVGLSALIQKGPALLDASEEQLPAVNTTQALRAIAGYIDYVPELGTLAKPLGAHIVKETEDLEPTEIADIVWTVGELRLSVPELLDTVLPHFVDTDPRHRRIRGLKYKMKRHYLANAAAALHKIRRDVPRLRELLPVKPLP